MAAKVEARKKHSVDAVVRRIVQNKNRYQAVESKTNVPWFVIAGLHNMEASGDFSRHLHEGSSLKWRTKYIPKGRPKTGNPPFTWEYSAIDALYYDSMQKKNWCKLGAALSACEGYNGWGVAKYHPSVPTPYLWAATTIEKPGKYIADGKWSPTARSKQIGIAAIWKRLSELKEIRVPSP
jgi:lysozyme family protein